jgi:hypothetical protein
MFDKIEKIYTFGFWAIIILAVLAFLYYQPIMDGIKQRKLDADGQTRFDAYKKDLMKVCNGDRSDMSAAQLNQCLLFSQPIYANPDDYHIKNVFDAYMESDSAPNADTCSKKVKDLSGSELAECFVSQNDLSQSLP